VVDADERFGSDPETVPTSPVISGTAQPSGVSTPTLVDSDEDGIPDVSDLFPQDRCEAFDLDGDGQGDAGDIDRDGDGVDNRWERRVGTDPNDPESFPSEEDSDEDGVPDYRDPFPEDTTRWLDLDGDGVGDEDDPDDDDDGIADEEEERLGEPSDDLLVLPACALNHNPGWYRGDFHSHSTYSEDALRQQGESLEDWIALLEYYRDPRFLAVHPEFADRPLDFQTLTDHRTLAGAFDPIFRSDLITLVPGEEIGGGQHTNGYPLLSRVGHEPAGDETFDERLRRTSRQIHWQGGVMQANHPANSGNVWTTSVDYVDAVEVWNAPWALESAATQDDLERAIAGRGEGNPYIRAALSRSAVNSNSHALAFWELMLSGGLDVAATGGSDRHMLLAPGFPTTWVFARSLTPDDIADGVRAGHTVITRGPTTVGLAATVTVEAAEPYIVGDTIPITTGAEVRLTVELERATGALVQVVAGPILDEPDAESLAELGPPVIIATHSVDTAAPTEWSIDIAPIVPGWMVIRVLEPISFDGFSADTQEILEGALAQIRPGLADPAAIATVLVPILPIEEMIGQAPCTEESWERRDELNPECFLVDQEPFYTFLLPDVLDRIMNYWSGPAPEGDWALGAMSSAFRFVLE